MGYSRPNDNRTHSLSSRGTARGPRPSLNCDIWLRERIAADLTRRDRIWVQGAASIPLPMGPGVALKATPGLIRMECGSGQRLR